MDPLTHCAVYFAPDRGRYVTVIFGLAPDFYTRIGTDEPPAPLTEEFWEPLDHRRKEYLELTADRSAPAILDTGRLPANVLIDGAPPDGSDATLTLIPSVHYEEALFTRPRCGAPSLSFSVTGS